ncbi:MAG: hypothetical protein U0931_41620 [Vulcanimicrobiota bacterium]
MSQLEQLLEAQLEGCLNESQGQFTLSLQEALRKLGRYASYHPDHWCLTLIQAFVALQARAVYVMHSGKDFWFVAHQCQADALSGLTGEALLRQNGHGLLARALAALLDKEPEQLLVCQWESPEKTPQIAILAGQPDSRLAPRLPPNGRCLGVYVQRTGPTAPLAPLLGYPLQYCPIPVHLLEKGWLLTSDQDLRASHWIDEAPTSELYPAELQTRVFSPLLLDRYEQGGSATVLLKPPGGKDLTYFADWCDQPEQLEWQSPPGLFDGTVSQGRYMRLGQAPLQNLDYQGGKSIGNTFLGQKSTRSVCLPLHTGDLILMLEERARQDCVLPIKHGVVLASLQGLLKIPGAVLVTDASGLVTDLSGMSLVRDQAFHEWIQHLRVRVETALEEAVSNPPQTHGRLSVFSTMLATGVTALGLACLDGLQGTDLMALTHGGLFGGMLVYGVATTFRHYAPDSWFAAHNARLHGVLQQRLEAARRARSQG